MHIKIKKQETNSLRRNANELKENLPLAKNNISHKDNIVNKKRTIYSKIKIADKVPRTDQSAFKSITLSANNRIS